MAELSALQIILQTKCPRLRRGNTFSYSAYNITKFDRNARE